MSIENSLKEPFNPLQLPEEFKGDADIYAAELMRNKVKEIIGSYHHQFDHFYECLQNAVDESEKSFYEAEKTGSLADYTPEIKVIINLQENSLTVIDNGRGMPKDIVFKYFFTPFATLKPPTEEIRQRGEKGVGATFLSYGSNLMQLTTLSKETGELTVGELKDGLKWCNNEKELLPMPLVKPCEPHSEINNLKHGTIVKIYFCEDTNMTSLKECGETLKHWDALLRLHTAIGYVDFDNTDPFLKSLRCTVTLMKDESGVGESALLTTGYLYPHLLTKSNIRRSSLSRDKQGRLHEAQRDMNIMWETFTYDQVSKLVTDRMGHTPYLRSKKRDSYSKILHNHKPEAYVAFTYATEFWNKLNDDVWGPSIEGAFKHGIVFATKSQKIGEQKRIDFTFRSGDFNRFFIVLNMQHLKADVGRKSLPEEIGDFANFFANSVNKVFTDSDDCLKPSPGPFTETHEVELERIKDEAYERVSLPNCGLPIIKVPKEEQDVIALFFSLLGSKLIRGYEIYSAHISRTYDGVGRFVLRGAPENLYDQENNRLGIASDKFRNNEVISPNKCFIEFKNSTDELVEDVRGGYKRLQDIKWLVCWEIGEKHKDEGIGIIDITEPSQINRREYYGVTHLMTEGQDKVFVICLKKVLEILVPN